MKGPLPPYTLLLVVSASHAVKGERALGKAGIPCRLIPVPRSLSSQCGVCLRVARGDRNEAIEILRGAGVSLTGVFDLDETSTPSPDGQIGPKARIKRKKEKTDGR